MNKTARWVLAVIAVQTVIIGVYWRIEHQRQPYFGYPTLEFSPKN